MRLLEEAGVIRGYQASIDRDEVGLGLTVFVGIKVERHRQEQAEAFHRAVVDLPEVISVHLVSGESDFLLQVVVPDLRAYERLLSETLLRLPGVSDIRSNFAIKTVKAPSPLPLGHLAGRSAAEEAVEAQQIGLLRRQVALDEGYLAMRGALRQAREVQWMDEAQQRIAAHALAVGHQHDGLAIGRNLDSALHHALRPGARRPAQWLAGQADTHAIGPRADSPGAGEEGLPAGCVEGRRIAAEQHAQGPLLPVVRLETPGHAGIPRTRRPASAHGRQSPSARIRPSPCKPPSPSRTWQATLPSTGLARKPPAQAR